MLKVLIGYPTPAEEFSIVNRVTSPSETTAKVIDLEQLRGYQVATDAVYVDPGVIEYAVRLASATRNLASVGLPQLARYVSFGASPRASINMILGAKALAFLRGRDYALPIDTRDLARDVLRHRVVLSYEGLADGVTPDDLIGQVLEAVSMPDIPMRERGGTGGGAAWSISRH
jgi:MoxR-like ATPase